MYWCERGRRIARSETCMPLNTLSDLYLGKKTPLFHRPELNHVPGTHCLVFASKVHILHLSAEFEKTRDAWLNGMCEILQVYTAAAILRRHNSLLPGQNSGADGAVTPIQQADSKGGKGKPSLVSIAAPFKPEASLSDGMLIMEHGMVFRSFFFVKSKSDEASRVVKFKDIFLFGYFPKPKRDGSVDSVDSDGNASDDDRSSMYGDGEEDGEPQEQQAALYWCEVGKRDMIAKQRFFLYEITDLYKGKKTPALRTIATADVPANQCWTFASKKKAIHLQAESEATRDSWLKAFIEVLMNYAKRQMVSQATIAL